MEVFLVYLWMQLPQFTVALAIASGALALGHIPISFYVLDKPYDVGRIEWKTTVQPGRLKEVKKFTYALGFLASMLIFLPSQGTVAAMVGTYYAKEAVTSVEGQKLMSLIRKKANEYLDKELASK